MEKSNNKKKKKRKHISHVQIRLINLDSLNGALIENNMANHAIESVYARGRICASANATTDISTQGKNAGFKFIKCYLDWVKHRTLVSLC